MLKLLLPNDNKVFVKRKTLMYVIFKLEKKYVLKAQHEGMQDMFYAIFYSLFIDRLQIGLLKVYTDNTYLRLSL